jgi:hypothetical protein
MDPNRPAERLEEFRRELLAVESYLTRIRVAGSELRAELARPTDAPSQPTTAPPAGG